MPGHRALHPLPLRSQLPPLRLEIAAEPRTSPEPRAFRPKSGDLPGPATLRIPLFIAPTVTKVNSFRARRAPDHLDCPGPSPRGSVMLSRSDCVVSGRSVRDLHGRAPIFGNSGHDGSHRKRAGSCRHALQLPWSATAPVVAVSSVARIPHRMSLQRKWSVNRRVSQTVTAVTSHDTPASANRHKYGRVR
jgi:hypothetical protein